MADKVSLQLSEDFYSLVGSLNTEEPKPLKARLCLKCRKIFKTYDKHFCGRCVDRIKTRRHDKWKYCI